MELQTPTSSKLLSKFIWKEAQKGEYQPIIQYDDNINENDEDTLNEIDHRKHKITKKNLVKFDRSTLQPGDLVYHKKHGYLRIERESLVDHNSDKKHKQWDCRHIITMNNEIDSDEVITNLNSEDMSINIELRFVYQVEKHPLGQTPYMKVLVNDKISTLVETYSIMNNAKLFPVYEGRALDQSKSFAEENVRDKAEVFLYGVIGKYSPTQGKLKFFKRYRDVRAGDSWYVGRDRWDAIMIIPKKSITIYGIGIFEKHPSGGEFQIGYKYHLMDSNDNEINLSEVHEETVTDADTQGVEDHVIKYRFKSFPKGIKVNAYERFNFCMWMTSDRCYYSETGDNYEQLENEDKDLFELRDSSLSSNSTRVNRGIIPGILYSY